MHICIEASGVRVVFHRLKLADRLIAVQVAIYYIYIHAHILYIL